MHRNRIQFLVVLLTVAFACIGARLVYLQHFQWTVYRVEAEKVRRSIRYIEPPRGSILDRHGTPLATDEPTHEITFSLQGVERARSITRNVARALRVKGLPQKPRLSEDYLVHRLHQARADLRPELIAGNSIGPRLWISRVSNTRLRALAAAIEASPDRYAGVVASLEHEAIFFDPSTIFAGEVGVLRLARRAGIVDLDDFYTERVWLPYLRARALVNRTARQWAFEEERVLLADVDFEWIVDLLYNPDEYPGLRVRQGRRRVYPQRKLLGQLIGYQGMPTQRHLAQWKEQNQLIRRSTDLYDIRWFLAIRGNSYLDNARVGVAGLERRFEDQLRGTAGAILHEVDRFQRTSQRPLDEAPAIPGNDVRLTLDAELCRLLHRLFEEREASAGSALVAIPSTGEILGWCSYPSFDPGRRSAADWRSYMDDPGRPLFDRPQRAAIPPGSTFKMVLAVGALQEELLEPDETVTCVGYYDPNNRNILRCRNHSHAWPDIDLTTAIAKSCNSFFYDLGGERLKADGIVRWATHFGFAERPGPAFARPQHRLRVDHPEVAAIGKGSIIATPLQVLRYVSTIANRGVRPSLHMTADTRPPGTRLPVEPEVWEAVIAGMEGTVRFGSASSPHLGLQPFSCALKTGTAAVSKEKDIAWLVGFAPVEDPKVAFIVALEDQQLGGGDGAGPYAEAILSWLEQEYDLPLRAPEEAR